MKTSLFDLFKIGIGPSSSHTVGPMIAAYRFAQGLAASGLLQRTTRLQTELYGSLALTGRGHHTDRAVLLGLSGEQPATVDPNAVESIVAAIRDTRTLHILGNHPVPFDEPNDLAFHTHKALPRHPNAVCFTAWQNARPLHDEIWYSIGGGFVVKEGESSSASTRPPVPYPFRSGAELLELCRTHSLSIPELMRANEAAWRTDEEISSGIQRLWQAMQDCTTRGLATEGRLPGGLNVKRRAAGLYRTLTTGTPDRLGDMDWLNVYAMAVNEENAAGGRVVTAPTNGAAGVIPAVAHYYINLLHGTDIESYLLAAAAIGVLYAENASISGAEVGCQGEVGVACSMAAGGLAAVLGGNAEQIEHAAEIGMEHNLGMTCDPIGGLVQIPCIERNAFGAVKAVNAARMAMRDTGQHKVSLDQVIRTMYQTGLDMQSKYKETSLAGLAVNVVEC
ncbi:MAG: L-serine ammonia-lyase [Bryobacteraceae bacterium]